MVFKIRHSWRKVNMLNKWSFLFQPSNSKPLNALFLILVSILSMELYNFKYIIWAIVVYLGNVLQYWSKQKLLHLYYQVLVCTLSTVSKQHEFPHLFDAFHLSFCHTELLPHLWLWHSLLLCFPKVLVRVLVYFVTRLWHLNNRNTQIHTYIYSILDLFQWLP